MKIAKFKNRYYVVEENSMVLLNDFSLDYLMDKNKLKEIKDYFEDNKKKSIILPDKLDPPVNPRKLMCIGRNYAEHAKETGHTPPKEPVFFLKAPSAIIGHGHDIIYPEIVTKLDYEVELAVIIGKDGKYISKEDAWSYVAGYTIMNDVSARDHQFRYDQQWFVGKSFDTFAPMGPWIVDKYEIVDPNNLDLKTWVNGEIRQNSNTSNMIFKIDFLISFISNVLTLEKGDVISTGTPSGVAMGMDEQKFLKPGDTIEMEIENIGKLINKVKKFNY